MRAPPKASPAPLGSDPSHAAQAEALDLGPEAFRQRALDEAQRYGSDPWICIRELLQNARDAGSTQVELQVETTAAYTALRCIDDGQGMSFATAQRHLFCLYSSSKDGEQGQAGRFGVGFWSILTCSPDHIVISSCPRDGTPAWQVELSGQLEHNQRSAGRLTRPGTVIELRFYQSSNVSPSVIAEAARKYARFLSQRAAPTRALRILVNGETINEAFTLPPPCLEFSSRGMRGVVGLGDAEGLELLSRGLLLRHASCPEELLIQPGGPSPGRGLQNPSLCLRPQVLVDSERLTPTLARSDARDDRELRRLVRHIQAATRRLIEDQLQAIDPAGPLERWIWLPLTRLTVQVRDRLALAHADGQAWLSFVLGLAVVACAGLTVWQIRGLSPTRGEHPPIQVSESLQVRTTHAETGIAQPTSWTRLFHTYGEPSVDTAFSAYGGPLNGAYEPSTRELYLRLLVAGDQLTDQEPFTEFVDCSTGSAGCTHLQFTIHDAESTLPLPTPTGMRIDLASITWRGQGKLVARRRSQQGQLFLQFDRPPRGQLSYAARPAPPDRQVIAHAKPRPLPVLTGELGVLVEQLRHSTATNDQVEAARAFVARRIQYSTDPPTIEAHRRALARGEPLLTRALTIAAGDCDVQNAVLVEILRALGHAARLAIGHLGSEGRFSPWRHAWVELLDPRTGLWRILDATPRQNLDWPTNATTRGITPQQPLTASTPVFAPPDEPSHQPRVLPADPPADHANGELHTAVAAEAVLEEPRPLDPTEPSPIAETHTPPAVQTDGDNPRFIGQAGLAILGLALFAGVLFRRLRTRRSSVLDGQFDLSRLVRAALEHPMAFRSMPRLFRQRLIPVFTGGAEIHSAVSLRRLQDASVDGRLFAASSSTPHSLSVVQRHATVLALDQDLARCVLEMGYGIPLDVWITRFETPQSDLLTALNQALATRESPRVAVLIDPGGDGRVHHLKLPRTSRSSANRPLLGDFDILLAVSAEHRRMRAAELETNKSEPQRRYELFAELVAELPSDCPICTDTLAWLAGQWIQFEQLALERVNAI